jgi:hypothetical protein
MVPPVPAVMTMASSLPPHCSMISLAGALSSCASGLSGWRTGRGCGVGDDLAEAAGHADVALGRVPRGLGRGADDLGAERLEHHLLLRLIFSGIVMIIR